MPTPVYFNTRMNVSGSICSSLFTVRSPLHSMARTTRTNPPACPSYLSSSILQTTGPPSATLISPQQSSHTRLQHPGALVDSQKGLFQGRRVICTARKLRQTKMGNRGTVGKQHPDAVACNSPVNFLRKYDPIFQMCPSQTCSHSF